MASVLSSLLDFTEFGRHMANMQLLHLLLKKRSNSLMLVRQGTSFRGAVRLSSPLVTVSGQEDSRVVKTSKKVSGNGATVLRDFLHSGTENYTLYLSSETFPQETNISVFPSFQLACTASTRNHTRMYPKVSGLTARS
jgi:hypothetical protein